MKLSELFKKFTQSSFFKGFFLTHLRTLEFHEPGFDGKICQVNPPLSHGDVNAIQLQNGKDPNLTLLLIGNIYSHKDFEESRPG